MNGKADYDREILMCERCNTELEYLSDNILMMAKGAGILNPGGGPLIFHLYRCPVCRELRFFEKDR